jgi:hypothetical protein
MKVLRDILSAGSNFDSPHISADAYFHVNCQSYFNILYSDADFCLSGQILVEPFGWS